MWTAGTIAWHGMQPGAADWSEESRLVAWTLADGAGWRPLHRI